MTATLGRFCCFSQKIVFAEIPDFNSRHLECDQIEHLADACIPFAKCAMKKKNVNLSPPWVFVTLQYIEKFSPLVESM